MEGLAAVKSVDVSRAWPDRVRIDVTEREAVAVVDRGGTLRGLDAEGVMFRRYPSRPTSLPVIRTDGRARTDALAEAARVAGSLPSDIAARVEYVEVRTVDTIALRLRNGRTVPLGERGRLGGQGPRPRGAARPEGVVVRRQRAGPADPAEVTAAHRRAPAPANPGKNLATRRVSAAIAPGDHLTSSTSTRLT